MKPRAAGPVFAPAQRGAASLIVVMLLFFVLSLTAAYTSRNLIFEQKTSANQSRSTAAFEAAEAGIEWALAQLNGGIINTSCTDAAPTDSFQQRYLEIPLPPAAPAASQGRAYARSRAAYSLSPRIWPTCVFNGASWDCTCPVAAASDPTTPVGTGPFPAFRVWLSTPEPTPIDPPPVANAASSPWTAVTPARPGFAFINSVGCTRLPAVGENCLDFIPRGEIGEGVSYQRTTLALRSGLSVAPAAAVTARLAVTPAPSPAPPLKVVNTDHRSGGSTVNYASTAPFNAALFNAESIPGTPPEMSFVADPKLHDLATVAPASAPPAPASLTAGERMFVSTFGMKRATYRNQPGLRVCASPCSATNVNTLLQNNPDRVIWVEGDLTVNVNIGSAGTPVLMIVNGATITFDADRTIFGFVYITGDGSVTPDTSKLLLPDGPTFIKGALVAEGNLVTAYAGTPASSSFMTVTYDRVALDRLRLTYGSWVRLGAAWRDFKVAP